MVNFIDSAGIDLGETVDEFAEKIMGEVVEPLFSEKIENLMHNIWYCIDASGARILEDDAKIISKFSVMFGKW